MVCLMGLGELAPCVPCVPCFLCCMREAFTLLPLSNVRTVPGLFQRLMSLHSDALPELAGPYGSDELKAASVFWRKYV